MSSEMTQTDLFFFTFWLMARPIFKNIDTCTITERQVFFSRKPIDISI